ncbi:MAG TPA: hemerythrin domain-containing protein [Alphaproteobacteria bacterium]|nr:hemerythrin domain-containing protein [Alphaproteobacteria bacterium]
MDIYQRIRQDHETARGLLGRLTELPDGRADERDRLFDTLKRELWVHAKVEEAVFYAVLKEARRTRGESLEAFNEHHLINSLLDELDAMPRDNVAWTAKLGVLKEVTEHHLDEEEEEVFEEAGKVIDEDQAKRLGQAFDERKEQGLAALEPVEEKPESGG